MEVDGRPRKRDREMMEAKPEGSETCEPMQVRTTSKHANNKKVPRIICCLDFNWHILLTTKLLSDGQHERQHVGAVETSSPRFYVGFHTASGREVSVSLDSLRKVAPIFEN